MAVTLSGTLAAHQKRPARLPVLAVTASAKRFGIEQPRWTRLYSGSEADAPTAAAIAGDGSLIRLRNTAGSLESSRVTNPTGANFTFAGWNVLAAVTAGNAIALASKSSELLMAYVDNAGLTLKVRTSSDNGATWSLATTVVTEAAAIVGMAIAYRVSDGEPCLLYCVGTDVKTLRRVGGVWAVAGLAWSRAASVATLTGVAGVHDGGDFAVVVTGTAVTTTHKRVWGAFFGDGSLLTADTWSGLVSLAEADSLSSVTFAGPAIQILDLIPHASYAHKEAGNVAVNRNYTAHTDSTGFPTGTWTEPAPHEALSAFGMARAGNASGVWAVTPMGVWYASRPAAVTNLVPNGGFESNLTGWAANQPASGPLTRSTAFSKFGAYSGKVAATVQYDGPIMFFTPVLNTTYTGSLWVYRTEIVNDWRLEFDNGGSISYVSTVVPLTIGWQRVTVTGLSAGVVSTSFRLLNFSAATIAADIYFDGAQIETGYAATPYIETDGAAATRSPDHILTSRVLSATFDQSPSSTRAKVVLDNHDGAFNAAPNAAYPNLMPGGSIKLQPGYASGTANAPEFGVSTTLTVLWLRYSRIAGRSVCTLELVGPWEMLAHWSPPQAWQTAAATLTRAAIFKRLANRAGITVNGSGSANWGADKPAFAIPAGERGEQVAERLFSVESSFLIPGTDFKYANPAAADAAALTYGPAGHPIETLELTDTAAGNWVRLVGPDRYADAQTPAEVYAFGPRLAIVRSLDASTDAKATAYADNALRHRVVLDEQGAITCPLDAGAELFDVIAITDAQLGLTARKARIIALSWRFDRGIGKGRANYSANYSLGGL